MLIVLCGDFPTLPGQVTCEVFQDAKPAMQVYTLRKRKATYDGINELTMYDRFPPASEHS
jgi:hypothetical protein